MISASPGFDSRPMHAALPPGSFPFIFGVSVLPHLGSWRKVSASLAREVISTFWIRRTDFQDWRCCLAGHRRLQSTSWIKPSYLLFGQHVNHKHLPSPANLIPAQHPLMAFSTIEPRNAQLLKPHFRASSIKHWWFSGKIGRCHLMFPSKQTNVGQPRVRFPADASIQSALESHWSFVFLVSLLVLSDIG
jgi:hypothetical protein